MIPVTDKSSFYGIKQDLSHYLQKTLPVKEAFLEKPRKPEHGHLSWPLFALAKQQKTSPQGLAKGFCQKIQGDPAPFIKSCEPLGGFLNFCFTPDYIQKKLQQLIDKKQLMHFVNQAEHWVMDFASPNVAKFMNIGHLRATVLGQALVNLSRSVGFKVTALNHLGDWGSQFGKLLWAYQKWGEEYDFKKKAFNSLTKLYVRFHQESQTDKSLLDRARQTFKKLEQGDPQLKKLWESFVQLSLKNYDKYWKLFNVKHDRVLGESFYIPLMGELKSRLTAKKLLTPSEGAKVVFLQDSKTPCLIFKSDGASTYSSRDLCSLIYRFETLKADRNLYITSTEQNLHFKQIFEVSQKLNPDWKNLHLNFGIYRFKGAGKMSSRKGKAVYLKDILEQAIQKVRQIIEERNPSLPDKDRVSQQVALGALVFNDLCQDRVKDVDFDWNKVLDFDGDSGPFVQYSLVRSRSLLKKAGLSVAIKSFEQALQGEKEQQLAWLLLEFESVCFQALQKLKPHLLARYLLELSKEFNRFYNTEKIIGHSRQKDLLLLVQSTHRVLDRGLEILNIPRPLAM